MELLVIFIHDIYMVCYHRTYVCVYNGDMLFLAVCSSGTRLPQQLLQFTTEIVDAMNYLSSKGFVHRSLQGKHVSINRGMHCKVSGGCIHFD